MFILVNRITEEKGKYLCVDRIVFLDFLQMYIEQDPPVTSSQVSKLRKKFLKKVAGMATFDYLAAKCVLTPRYKIPCVRLPDHNIVSDDDSDSDA